MNMSEKNDKLLENDLIPSRLGVIQYNVPNSNLC